MTKRGGYKLRALHLVQAVSVDPCHPSPPAGKDMRHEQRREDNFEELQRRPPNEIQFFLQAPAATSSKRIPNTITIYDTKMMPVPKRTHRRPVPHSNELPSLWPTPQASESASFKYSIKSTVMDKQTPDSYSFIASSLDALAFHTRTTGQW